MQQAQTEVTDPAPQIAVTKDDIEAAIVEERHIRLSGTTTTLAYITLTNGTVVVGKSACVDPVYFDEQMGRELASADARRQIWPLLGFQLACKVTGVDYFPNVGRPPV